MIRPAVEFRNTDRSRAALYIASDASQSMTTPDGPAGTTRRKALLDRVEESRPSLEKLGKSIEIRYVDFAEQPTQVERPAEAATGTQTAIGSLLEWVGHESQNQRIAGIVLSERRCASGHCLRTRPTRFRWRGGSAIGKSPSTR